MRKQTTPSTETSIAQIPFDPNCAWCLDRAGIKPQSGSHGICPTDEAIIYQQVEAYRAEKKARKH